jgi:DNA replication protein DnaC
VLYTRLNRLLDDLAVARVEGGANRLLRKLAKVAVLILDDFAMTELTAAQRRDLMEVIDDRHERGATVIATQVPVERWHHQIGEPNTAGCRHRRRGRVSHHGHGSASRPLRAAAFARVAPVRARSGLCRR